MKMSTFAKRCVCLIMAVLMLLSIQLTAAAAGENNSSNQEMTFTVTAENPNSITVGPIAPGTSAPGHLILNKYIGLTKTFHIKVLNSEYYSGEVYGTMSKDGNHIGRFSMVSGNAEYSERYSLPSSGEYYLTIKNDTNIPVTVQAWWQ